MAGVKYMRREAARDCPIHTAICATAANRLERYGFFSKEEVITDLNFGTIADAVRWDYIKEFLQADHGIEMVPLAAAYFKRHARRKELVDPGAYLAQGYGKKTAGFAAVTPENDHLVIHRIQQRKAMGNGVAKSFQAFVDRVNAKREKNSINADNAALLEELK